MSTSIIDIFGDLKEKMSDLAFEHYPESFGLTLESTKYTVDLYIDLTAEGYKLGEIDVYDENNKEYTGRFVNVAKDIARYLPDADEVKSEKAAFAERNVPKEVLYFGSYAGYQKYRYG
jgi:hypothetical protein